VTRSYSRRAVTYKTWHDLRWWLLLTLFFLWVGWLWPWLREDANSVLAQELDQITGGTPANQLNSTLLWMLVLGALPMTLERRRSTLLTTLAGPVRRRDLYNIQCGWCVGTVWLGLVLLAVYVGILNASLHGPLTVAQLLEWLWRQLVLHTAALTVGLAAGAIIGSHIMAFFCALGVACFPAYVSMTVGLIADAFLLHLRLAHHVAPVAQYQWLSNITWLLFHLSPLARLDTADGTLAGVLATWFILWSAGWYALGLRLFERLPLEREGSLFPYPVCWQLLLLGVGLIFGMVVAGMVTRAQPAGAGGGWTVGAAWAAVTVVVWQLLALVRRVSLARRRE
jgi:hypothetical protein